MRTFGVLGLCALAASALAFAPLTTSGPYLDSKGQVWFELPKLSDYPDAATFDNLFGHEVFTTAQGQQFQIDRPWTAEELAQNVLQGQINQALRPQPGPGGNIRATVRSWHPVDEEYRANFATIPLLKTHVRGVVDRATAAMNANWGILLKANSGFKWDSNDNGDIVDLLDEAWREGNGTNGLEIMIALSDDPTPGGAIGVAYLGLPRQLVKKYQTFEAEIMEHETGHNYTLNHCCDNNCIMQPFLDVGAFGNFHNYQENCSGQNHYATMNNQKNRY